MRLAHLGPAGTFGESAALAWAPGAELVPMRSHAAVVGAVAQASADAGVLAVENSLEGSVSETLDLLIHDTDLRITGEVIVPVEHCLLAPPGTRLKEVSVVYSHPQALGQCRAFLERALPEARLEATLSTVHGVERALSEQGGAAIAAERAAAHYGAAILERAIQDRSDNVTRFVIVASSDAAPTGDDKTSLAFKTAHDQPGTLVDVLAELSSRGVNLTKIESRPSRDALGIYVFLVDLEGHREDAVVAEALRGVAQKTSWLVVFGSYPRAR